MKRIIYMIGVSKGDGTFIKVFRYWHIFIIVYEWTFDTLIIYLFAGFTFPLANELYHTKGKIKGDRVVPTFRHNPSKSWNNSVPCTCHFFVLFWRKKGDINMKKKTNSRLVPVITMLSLFFLFFNIEQLKNIFPTDISSGNTSIISTYNDKEPCDVPDGR